MKTLFLECNMGATDTMLLSALYDACEHKASFLEIINETLAPFSITVSAISTGKCGILGTKIVFEFPDLTPPATPEKDAPASAKNEAEEHLNYLLAHAMQQHRQESASTDATAQKAPTTLPQTLADLSLPSPVKEDISAIYEILSEAATSLGQGARSPLSCKNEQDMKSLAIIAGCALLIYMMVPEQIICSPLHIGSVFVKNGDMVVSVPAPITAALLKNIPCYTSNITGSLLDDTNAAILKYFVTQFSIMPALTIHSIGYGIGMQDFAIANYTRVFWGDTELYTPPVACVAAPESNSNSETFSNTDTIVSIACNVDDMTGEALSLATEILLAAGALDVYTTSIQMKKNRPGVLLTCLCEEADREKFIGLFFLHTSTQEVRYQTFTRAKLESTVVSRHSAYGNIRVKKSTGYGVEKEKPDFEDLKSIVLKNGVTIADISFDEFDA